MIRHINDAGLHLIMSFEGLRLNAYVDIGGRATIGYGHLIKSGEDFNSGITKEQAEDLLKNDLLNAEQEVEKLVTVPLTDNQFAALVSLVYNCGIAPLVTHLGEYLNDGEYENAAQMFLLWDHVNGAVSDGLERRRQAEKDLFQQPN